MTVLRAVLPGLLLCLATGAGGYPLDGGERTNIRRLEGYRNAQLTPGARKLPPGALLGVDDIRLGLTGSPDWDLAGVEKDPRLQAALGSIFADRDPSYAVAVIDITDPEDIAWAGVREDVSFFPGSVGKMLTLIALFDGLAQAFPDTTERVRVLRDVVRSFLELLAIRRRLGRRHRAES